ncbi:MAG TPA: transporter substrate-binding domain-containing protein [Burkholderiales bacterium]|nr:transporter substrate-binding domain-containing protein [Burkholderiales bacterium]
MRTKNVVLALCALAALAIASAAAQAQSAAPGATKSRLHRVLESGVLRVGTTGDFRPMSFRDAKTNEYAGHDIEVARELAKDLGVKLEIVPTEWKTLISGIQTDKYDVAMSGISMNVDRAKVAAFTVPYMEFGTVPVVRRKDVGKFKGWNDLDKPNVIIATTLGTVFDQQAKEYFKRAKRKQVEAPALSYQEVLAGRAEACITSNVEAASLVQTYPQLAIVPVDRARSRRPASLLVAQDDLVWLNFLNQWITMKRSSEFFDGLQKKWLQ